MRRILSAIGTLLVLMLVVGCGSKTVTVTAPVVSPASTAPPTTTPATTAAAPSTPVVKFIEHATVSQAGNWPFSAQLVSIQTDVNGFGGIGAASHNQNQTDLEVQIGITDLMPGQLPPIPNPGVQCVAPDLSRTLSVANTAPGGFGWDAGPDEGPDTTGDSVPMGDGQPHDWDEEWAVPVGFNVAGVKCSLVDTTENFGLGPTRVEGNGALN